MRAQRVQIIDIAVPLDKNIQMTYKTKIQKYGQLKQEITEMWRMKSSAVHPIVISATGNVYVRCVSQLKDLGVDRVLADVQKAILLIACCIVRSFFDHQKEVSQPLFEISNFSNVSFPNFMYLSNFDVFLKTVVILYSFSCLLILQDKFP